MTIKQSYEVTNKGALAAVLVYGPEGGPYTVVDTGTPLPTTGGGGGGGGGDASAANQTTEIGHLASLVAKDYATQVTLAALNAKVTAVNTGAVVLAAGAAIVGAVTQSGTWHVGNVTGTVSLPTGAATAAHQVSMIAALASLDVRLDVLNSVDYATQATLAALNAKVTACDTGAVVIASPVAVTGTFWQATQPVSGTFWQATQPVSGTFWQATQPVSIATAPALVASEAHVGQTGSPNDVISVTPTVSDGTNYTAGDAIGGIQTLTNAVRVSGGTALLNSVLLIDKSNQKQAITILFFESNPAAATTADNSPFAWSTDIAKYIGKVDILAADYTTTDSIGTAMVGGLARLFKASGSANLYAVALATGISIWLPLPT